MATICVILFIITFICRKSATVEENLINSTVATSDFLLREIRNNIHQEQSLLENETNFSTNHSYADRAENNLQNEINTVNPDVVETFLTKYSLVYGLTVPLVNNNLSNLNVNPECVNDMKIIKHAIDNREIWAIKLFDSSGTFGSGFILGNNFWLGSKKSCDSLNEKLSITLSNRFDRHMVDRLMDELSPVEVKFRMLHIKHNSPWQLETRCVREGILHVGLCVPKSCSNNEIEIISQHVFNQNTLQLENIYEFQSEVINVRSLELSANFFNKITVKIFIFLVMTTTILSICAGYSSTDESNQRSIFQRVVACFSVKHNFFHVVSMEATPRSLPVINGLRSIACILIMILHILFYMYNTIDNPALYFHYSEKFIFQVIVNSPMIVDLFFALSGFLLADNFLRNKNQIIVITANSFCKNVKLFGRMLIRRYLRLSPLYMLTILIIAIVTAYLTDVSYFHINERNDLLFNKYWWRNLLYIQNLFHVDDLSGNWTWYLACEMQYFFIFTIILFVYAKNPGIAKNIFFLSWFILIFTTLSIALYKEYIATFDVMRETANLLYVGPWARIHPYYIGVLSAYYLQRNEGRTFINKKYLLYISIGNMATALICLHITMLRDSHFILCSISMIVGRLLFGIAIMWVIMTSITSHKNWLTTFLEHRIFVHISKVSYAMYLLNPIIVAIIFSLRDSPMHIEIITLFVITISIMIIIYILSVAFTTLFEVPYNRLSDEFIRIHRKKLSTKD